MKYLILSVFASLLLIVACTDSNDVPSEHQPRLPEQNYNYSELADELAEFIMPSTLQVGDDGLDLPGSFSNSSSFFTTSVNHDAKATLGRVLFYDNRMSKNNSIACASCHKQNLAFADDAAVSQGFGGKHTTRNSMALTNSVLSETFFWDGRSRSLQDLALRPVFNHIEMGIDNVEELVTKLSQEPYYSNLFQDAYGDDLVTGGGIQEALAAFIMSVTSTDSRFDEGMENQFTSFSELEKHGMALFFSERAQCSSCHNGRNFASPTGFSSNNPYRQTSGTTNIGLDVIYEDQGFSDGKFKIPSLRNIALTAPYMHDGRFETLMDVVNHYDQEVQPHTDLDVKLKSNGSPQQLGLTELDKDALVAFMTTLSSKSILSDERYSNPF